MGQSQSTELVRASHGLAWIPCEILRHILLDWLQDLQSIAAFDTACSSRPIRSLFLTAVSGATLPGELYLRVGNSRLWSWLSGRNLAVAQVTIACHRAQRLAQEPRFACLSKILSLTIFLDAEFPLRDLVLFLTTNDVYLTHLKVCFRRTSAGEMVDVVECLATLSVKSLTIKEINDEIPHATMDNELRSQLVVNLLANWAGRREETALSALDTSFYGAISTDVINAVGNLGRSLKALVVCCKDMRAGAQELLSALLCCPSLTSLILRGGGDLGTNLNVLVSALPHMPHLRVLEVDRCPNVPKFVVLPVVLQHCRALQHVSLCHDAYKEFFYSILNHELVLIPKLDELPQLCAVTLPTAIRTLRLQQVGVPASSVLSVVDRFGEHLTALEYSGPTLLNRAAIDRLRAACPKLTEFRFLAGACTQTAVYFDALLHFTDQFQGQLTALSLSWCRGLGEVELCQIFEKCQALRSFELSYGRIGWVALDKLLRSCSDLRLLGIHFSKVSVPDVAKAIVSAGRALRPFKVRVSPVSRAGVKLYSRWSWSYRLVDGQTYILMLLDDHACSQAHNKWRRSGPDGQPWIQFVP